MRVGLTDAELEEERMAEMERVMRSDAEMREQRERAAAEDALLRAARQDDWVQRLSLLPRCAFRPTGDRPNAVARTLLP